MYLLITNQYFENKFMMAYHFSTFFMSNSGQDIRCSIFTHTPLGGSESSASCFFQNNSKTVAGIDTKFVASYPASIWHRMAKFCRNRPNNCWEMYFFVGSLHVNFEQNRLNVKKLAKNRVLRQTAQKSHLRCKITRSTKWLPRNFKILSF